MKQKKLIAAVGAAVVLGFGGATAQAADNFTGPYVGGALALFNSTNVESNILGDVFDGVASESLGSSDTLNQLDLVIGYGMLMNNDFYLAAEARYSVADRFDNTIIRLSDDFFAGEGTVSAEGDGGYALMFQAGYAVNNNIVLYGTAGYANRDWKIKDSFTDSPDEKFSSSGVAYGMGVIYSVNRNFSVNAEVLKTNYSSTTVLDENDDLLRFKPDSVSASVGVAYRF